jgi:hypothetical protein
MARYSGSRQPTHGSILRLKAANTWLDTQAQGSQHMARYSGEAHLWQRGLQSHLTQRQQVALAHDVDAEVRRHLRHLVYRDRRAQRLKVQAHVGRKLLDVLWCVCTRMCVCVCVCVCVRACVRASLSVFLVISNLRLPSHVQTCECLYNASIYTYTHTSFPTNCAANTCQDSCAPHTWH